MRQNQEFLANAGFFSRSYYQSMHEFWRLLVQMETDGSDVSQYTSRWVRMSLTRIPTLKMFEKISQ